LGKLLDKTPARYKRVLATAVAVAKDYAIFKRRRNAREVDS
jgi:hypothetical protein